MKLMYVVWNNQTEFLIEAETEDEAVKSAIMANKALGNIEGEDLTNPDEYSVQEVDYGILDSLFKQNNYRGIYETALVFED